MDHFKLHSKYKPTGDQPHAIEELVKGFEEGNQFQVMSMYVVHLQWQLTESH